MKTLLVGINAKFIHSNLAIRCLKKYTQKKQNIEIDICEYTINQQQELIMREIYKQKPDVIGFSCYIWNYELIKNLVFELKKLMPNVIIFLGGPEVSFNSVQVLETVPCDLVISGEGEEIFCEFITCLNNNKNYFDVKGITYRFNDEIIKNEPMPPVNLDDVPFVYDEFFDLENRIVYYEASRGCPFKCQYCLSSGSKGVRFLSLERVFKDLKVFLNANVRQVKFVDRTFNCDKKYSMAIWRFLSENDNGITNFHFEMAAELIDDEMISFLHTVRKGLFQFEIGVQSTNKETLKAIKRVTLPEKLTPIVKALQKENNIHLHLDLIAGLPYEDYNCFKNSFNYVYTLSPDQFQLGFLKLLKGSGLYENKEKYNLVCTDSAPYEVLKTNWLSYDELLRLKMIEEMVETYYNSNRYQLTIRYLVSLFETPFDFYEALADFYEENNFHLAPHSKVGYYEILGEFFKTLNFSNFERFKWYMLYDSYSHEKAKKLPDWLNVSMKDKYKKLIYDFVDNKENIENYLKEYLDFDTKQIIRSAHIEVFPFNPITDEQKLTSLLFNYRNCDLLGNAKVVEIKI